MIVPTDEIRAVLLAKGFTRDDSQPYGCAGYRSTSGTFIVIDESISYQDTTFVIEDCVANECYEGAAVIKAWVEEQTKKVKKTLP